MQSLKYLPSDLFSMLTQYCKPQVSPQPKSGSQYLTPGEEISRKNQKDWLVCLSVVRAHQDHLHVLRFARRAHNAVKMLYSQSQFNSATGYRVVSAKGRVQERPGTNFQCPLPVKSDG